LVDSGHAEGAEYGTDGASSEFGALVARDEIEKRRDAVGSKEGLDLPCFHGRPESRGRTRVGTPLHDRIEDHVEVDQDPLHRYLRSRYLW
jgi:hypothetical protein